MKIFDSHVHIGKTEKIERSFSFMEFYSYMRNMEVSGSIVMPNVSSILSCFELNKMFLNDFDYLGNEIKKNFYPFILIDPNDIEIFPQLNRKDIYGLKIHPSILQITICDSIWKPFFKMAENRNLPILVHCGRNNISHISHLIEASFKYNNNIFIAAHLGGNASDLIDEAISLVKKANVNNLYLDTSAVKLPYLIEKAVKILGSDKIIFGSDEPYFDLRVSIYCLEISNILDREKVLFKNIENILGEVKNERNKF